MEWIELGDAFIIIRNGKSIKQHGEDGYPITRIETIADRYVDEARVGYASIYDLKEYEDYILQKGDILMSHINSVKHLAKTAIFNSESILIHGMNLLCLRANKNIIDPYYGYYYLNSDIFLKQIPQITKNSVNQASFNITNLKRLKIPVPPMEIQKQIVEVLDEAQKLIDNRKKQIGLLDELIESIFYDMFGDPVRNDKGWEVKKLGEFGEWASGGTPPRKVKEYFNGEINWFSAGELNSRYVYESEEKITEEAIEESSAKLFDKNTILLGMYDSAAFKLSILKNKSSSNQACANLKCNTNYNVEWVYTLFEFMRPIYLQSRKGVRQKNLSQKVIKNFEAISPPIQLQNQFAQKVELIESQKVLMEESLKLMEDNYNSLMQRAFREELFCSK